MEENKMIAIRTCSQKDIPILTHLIRCSFKDVAVRFGLTPENCPTHPSNYTIQRVISDMNRGMQYFILEKNKLPCGSVALEKAAPKAIYLERLAVLPEQRNQGYGRTLVDRVIEEAKLLGAELISLGMISAQPDLKTWYRNIGFIEGETKDFAHLPFSVTYMILNLS
jgi:N-acetylglutamate synthase-like GNAT family acetyltransferase